MGKRPVNLVYILPGATLPPVITTLQIALYDTGFAVRRAGQTKTRRGNYLHNTELSLVITSRITGDSVRLSDGAVGSTGLWPAG
jgi:hypothetical protein